MLQHLLDRVNEHDLDERPAETRRELDFVLVDSIDQVLEVAFDGSSNGHAAVNVEKSKSQGAPVSPAQTS